MRECNGDTYSLPRRGVDGAPLLAEVGKVDRSRSLSYKGRVLVMDDDSVIRNLLGVMLMALGYEAQLTPEGAEAVRSYKEAMEAGRGYDVVIIDLHIPGGMGGEETIRRLLELDQGVKAIVSSGFDDDPCMTHYGEFGFRGILRKPYSIADLKQVLREVIFAGSAERGLRSSFPA